MKKKIYLCGKCEGWSYEKMNSWRENIESLLQYTNEHITTFNPCYYWKDKFENKQPRTDFENLQIKKFDLHHLKTSDILVVNCEDLHTSVGSVYEIAVAEQLSIPIIAFNVSKFNRHDWLTSSFDWCCVNIRDVVDIINTHYNIQEIR